MTSLLLRNLVFTILKPGIVVGLIPFLIIRHTVGGEFSFSNGFQYLGFIVFTIGFLIAVSCIFRFAFEGRGTLSPLDPTQKLVINGFYKFTRNPMYVGVLTMLFGEVIFFNSFVLLMYSFCVFLLFNLFIYLIEEPRLKKDFPKEYLEYCNRVKRWF